jgi:ubiquinone biosynthesis protein
MVVVEGVARSLYPQINIWEVARPIVEDYIKQSIGPRAVLRDLGKTAQVLARFGPRLPALVEAALIRQAIAGEVPQRVNPLWPVLWLTLGAVAGAGGAIGAMLLL